MLTQNRQKEGGKMPMTDKWSGLADLLARMIEKYAMDIGIDDLPDPSSKGATIVTEKEIEDFSESSVARRARPMPSARPP